MHPSSCAEHFNIMSDSQDKMTFCLCLCLSEAIHSRVISCDHPFLAGLELRIDAMSVPSSVALVHSPRLQERDSLDCLFSPF